MKPEDAVAIVNAGRPKWEVPDTALRRGGKRVGRVSTGPAKLLIST